MQRAIQVGACLLLAAAASAAACGGSSAKPQAEPKPKPTAEELERQRIFDERQALEREKPESPLELRKRQAFRVPERCGQGPYRMKVSALESRFSERYVVYLCGPRHVAGAYRSEIRRPWDKQPHSWEQRFGSEEVSGDHRECLAGADERVVLRGEDPAPASPEPAGKGGKRKGKPLAPAKPKEQDRLSAERTLSAEAVPLACAIKTSIGGSGWSTERGQPMSEATITLDVWFPKANLLEGAYFVVEQLGTRDGLTQEQWDAYRKADEAWNQRYRALLDEEVAVGLATVIDTSVKAPPPPRAKAEAPPPKPSANATWIPGSWHYEAGSYHWLAGLWRVPEEDVRAERTAMAPQAPPPPRAEAVAVRPPPPSARAVWTPGSWQWDGGAYVWIDGTWRIPPSEGQTWTPPVWRPRVGGGVILRPGGWTIRVGR